MLQFYLASQKYFCVHISYLNQLLKFFDKYNVFTNSQQRFRSTRATNIAIYAFYQKLVAIIGAGECPVGIFYELGKAFDCFDRP